MAGAGELGFLAPVCGQDEWPDVKKWISRRRDGFLAPAARCSVTDKDKFEIGGCVSERGCVSKREKFEIVGVCMCNCFVYFISNCLDVLAVTRKLRTFTSLAEG